MKAFFPLTVLCLAAFSAAVACYPSVDEKPIVLTCKSEKYWDGVEDGGDVSMHPGVPCLACHYENGVDGGLFTAAGTVFASYHEQDECRPEPVTGGKVEILFEDGGLSHTITVDKSGNFINRVPMPIPYRAQVTLNGKTRRMVAAQSVVDCNSCHTATGAQKAPGRIIWP